MKQYLFILLLIILFFPPAIFSQSASQSGTDITYNRVLKDVSELVPVSEAVIPQEGISFNQDVGIFQLNKGTIIKLSPIAGLECAYLFKGEGKFEYSPSTKVEKEQLYRFYETESFDEKFNQLFMIITDSSFFNKINKLEFYEPKNQKQIQFDSSGCIDYIVNTDKAYCDGKVVYPFLEEEYDNFFYSHINSDEHGLLFFEVNPCQYEGVRLLRKAETGFVIDKKRKEVINQFESDKRGKDKKANFDKSFSALYYRINFNIEDNLDIKAKCIEVVKRNLPGRKWLKQYLYSDLVIDSIYLGDDLYSDYHKGEENPELWIKLPDDSELTKEYSLTIYYSGEILDKNEFGWIGLKSSLGWYPNPQTLDYSMFDVTFTYPEKYTLISVGQETFYEENEDFKTSQWKTDYPVAAVSFNIGIFKKYEFPDLKGVDVEVYISEAGHREMASVLANYYDIYSSSDPEEKIGSDVQASIQFYSSLFGKIHEKKINVTEIPYSHGQAFPGMIHLSWINYQGTQYDGSDEEFRAHEVAHQWWGHGVRFATYHDQWLDEGFAEYSALMFVQAGFKDNDIFFNLLNDWKNEIFNNRVYLFSTGQEAGPIWLGYRTSTSTTKGDYSLIIYKKGAWVLHMMRNMLLNLKTMNEDPFNAMMKDYFNTYYGKKVTTEDFKKIADKHFGEDMSWFFNQYVYGTDVPTYNFSYKSEELENGKYKVTCKVVQEDVPEDFKMYVPIKILLSGDRFARLRIEVKQKETILNLPLLPDEPEDIIFNDLESVLCKVNYESWDDE